MNIPISKRLLEWINRNKFAFIIWVSVLGNCYQYMQGIKDRDRYLQTNKELQIQMNTINRESLIYERERENKLDDLNQELLRHKTYEKQSP
jgi:hypothetical protein